MANKRPGALPQKTAEMLEAAVLRAAITGQTNRDLAREFGVHYQTVQNLRTRLKRSGVLQPIRKGKESGGPLAVGKDAEGAGLMPWRTADMADFLKRLPDMRGLTDPEKINLLSHIAIHGQGPTQVTAVKALADLEDTIRARTRVTLEFPKTREEKLERLRRMCEVVGEKLWLAALAAEQARVEAIEVERRARLRGGSAAAGAATSEVPAVGSALVAGDAPSAVQPAVNEGAVGLLEAPAVGEDDPPPVANTTEDLDG